MGSTANEEFERRIAGCWCGSRVAGWRVAVVKTSASLVEKASLASKASLVSLDTEWNDGASNENDDDLQKTGNQCDACDSSVGMDGFDGVDGDGFDGFEGSDDVDGVDGDGFDGFDGFDGWGDSSEMEGLEM